MNLDLEDMWGELFDGGATLSWKFPIYISLTACWGPLVSSLTILKILQHVGRSHTGVSVARNLGLLAIVLTTHQRRGYPFKTYRLSRSSKPSQIPVSRQ